MFYHDVKQLHFMAFNFYLLEDDEQIIQTLADCKSSFTISFNYMQHNGILNCNGEIWEHINVYWLISVVVV